MSAHDRAQRGRPYKFPTTVQGVLAARIDRLALEEKALLQQLAVIGREFPVSLLRQVITQPEDELYRLLSSLQRKEFLYEQPAFPGSGVHLQARADAGSRLWHGAARAAQNVARAHGAGDGSPVRSHLGRPLQRLGPSLQPQRQCCQGHGVSQLAGQQAVRQSANAEAITHLTTALELLKTLPDTTARTRQELTLHLSLGASLMATKGYAAAEVEHTYTRARELCLAGRGAAPGRASLYGLWVFYAVRADLKASRALGEQFLTLAQQTTGFYLVPRGPYCDGGNIALPWRVHLRPQAHLDQAAAFYDPEQHRDLAYHDGQDPGLMALAFAVGNSLVSWLPRPSPGESVTSALLSPRAGSPFELGSGARSGCLAYICSAARGKRLKRRRRRHMMLAHEHGFAFWLAMEHSLQGWALVEHARCREHGAEGSRHRADPRGAGCCAGHGGRAVCPAISGRVGPGYAQGGQAEEGLRVIAEALAMVEKNEERWNEAELYRIKGELSLQKLSVISSQVVKLPTPDL